MAGEDGLILELFQEGGTFSTSEIVEAIYGKELFLGPQEKAKYHRKLIYYLNKLVERRILTVSGYKSKGEKCFSVAGDAIVELPSNKIRLSKKEFSLGKLNMENLSVFEYQPFGIMINAIIINSTTMELPVLSSAIKELFSEVNDLIAVHSIERILATSSVEELNHFFSGINNILNGRKLVLIINYEAQKNLFLNKTINTIKEYEDIQLVLLLEENSFLSRTKELSSIIEHIMESGLKINISKKGKKIIIPGNAGAYSVNIDREAVKIICANSICLDLEKIKRAPASKIRQIIMDVVKGLHNINVLQQLEYESLFPVLSSYGALLSDSVNGIRFWNYDWKTDEYLIELLNEFKEEVNEFTHNEENIYVSCGMPIKFNIKFGSAFNSFDRKNLSSRYYDKNVISNPGELNNLNNEYFNIRRKFFTLFDLGDRIRIFRNKESGKNLLNEFHLLITTNTKFFTYDFRGLNKEVNLRDFM